MEDDVIELVEGVEIGDGVTEEVPHGGENETCFAVACFGTDLKFFDFLMVAVTVFETKSHDFGETECRHLGEVVISQSDVVGPLAFGGFWVYVYGGEEKGVEPSFDVTFGVYVANGEVVV